MCPVDKMNMYTDKVIDMHEKGCSYETISEALGLTESEIRTIINFYYY